MWTCIERVVDQVEAMTCGRISRSKSQRSRSGCVDGIHLNTCRPIQSLILYLNIISDYLLDIVCDHTLARYCESVVRATIQVNGETGNWPFSTPKPLNRSSPNIAHVIRFKFGKDMEDGPCLRTDHKKTELALLSTIYSSPEPRGSCSEAASGAGFRGCPRTRNLRVRRTRRTRTDDLPWWW